MNRLCLAAGVTLIESGSAGYLGQVSVIRKVSKDPHLNTCICACTVLVYTIVHVYTVHVYTVHAQCHSFKCHYCFLGMGILFNAVGRE